MGKLVFTGCLSVLLYIYRGMAINVFCLESEADLHVFAVSALVLYFYPIYFEFPLEWAFHRGPPGYNSDSDLPKL